MTFRFLTHPSPTGLACSQVVPHVTDCIQEWISEVAKMPVDGSSIEPDVCLVEVGGTVGDIESMVFLEARRQFK